MPVLFSAVDVLFWCPNWICLTLGNIRLLDLQTLLGGYISSCPDKCKLRMIIRHTNFYLQRNGSIRNEKVKYSEQLGDSTVHVLHKNNKIWYDCQFLSLITCTIFHTFLCMYNLITIEQMAIIRTLSVFIHVQCTILQMYKM